MKLHTILVLDDDLSFLDSMKLALSPKFNVYAHQNIKDAKKTLSEKPIQLAIVDYSLNDESGFDFAKWILTLTPRPPWILVTAFANKDILIESVDLDVFSVVEKPFAWEKMQSAIDRALRTDSNVKSLLVSKNIVLNLQTFEVHCAGENIRLTQTEFLILKILIEKKNQRVEREEIVQHIWGNMNVAKNTFDTHFTNLKKKLPVLRNNLRVIRGLGYVFQDH
jgi:DNA-binding response OmpR family regulator